MSTLVVIPVKSFDRAKARLAPVLDRDQRAALACRLAEGVVRAAVAAARPAGVLVVGDTDAVATWASALGVPATVVDGDLDAAATAGHLRARRDGHDRVLVAHADLRHPEALAGVVRQTAALIVPDRHLQGTNVLAVPSNVPFEFAYGPGSFDRHVAAARAAGFELEVLTDSPLAHDVDTPDDLRAPVAAAEVPDER